MPSSKGEGTHGYVKQRFTQMLRRVSLGGFTALTETKYELLGGKAI